jgi:hypothetical protein
MSKKDNRICKVCKEKYYFCPSCGAISASEKYKTMFCSKNCYDIFNTLTKVIVGSIDKSAARDILSSLDLSNQNQFNEGIKNDIDEIMKTSKKNKKKEKNDIIEHNDLIVVDNQVNDVVVENIEMQLIVDESNQFSVDIEPEFQVVI